MKLASYGVSNSYAPQKGPRAATRELDFGSVNEIKFDLEQEVSEDTLDFVQTVWVDNLDNTAPLILTVPITGQRLKIRAGAMGVYPFIATPGSGLVATTTAVAGLICKLIFLNVPMPHWSEESGIGDEVGGDITSFEDVALNNGAITTVLAANALRRSVLLVADPANSVNIRVGGSTTAATTGAELQPGQAISIPASGGVYAYAGAAGQSVSGFWIGE